MRYSSRKKITSEKQQKNSKKLRNSKQRVKRWKQVRIRPKIQTGVLGGTG